MHPIDLNDVRIFERVGTLRGFSAAAKALALPKSTVSRSVSRLEASLGVRLLQRTTRDVLLTAAGDALLIRCAALIGDLDFTLHEIQSTGTTVKGALRVSAAIGFGINVLAAQVPAFLERYPNVELTLDLGSEFADLVGSGFDIAVRLGPMPSSSLIATRLGSMSRHLCVSPTYVARRGTPRSLAEIAEHDVLEMPGTDGRPRTWLFTRDGVTTKVDITPRVCVNDALTIQRLVSNGVGLGIISGYLCQPELAAGRLVRLFPEWKLPSVDVSLVYPSSREVSTIVRAFIDFMKEVTALGALWLDDSSINDHDTHRTSDSASNESPDKNAT